MIRTPRILDDVVIEIVDTYQFARDGRREASTQCLRAYVNSFTFLQRPLLRGTGNYQRSKLRETSKCISEELGRIVDELQDKATNDHIEMLIREFPV